jgi:hypothetical protein
MQTIIYRNSSFAFTAHWRAMRAQLNAQQLRAQSSLLADPPCSHRHAGWRCRSGRPGCPISGWLW